MSCTLHRSEFRYQLFTDSTVIGQITSSYSPLVKCLKSFFGKCARPKIKPRSAREIAPRNCPQKYKYPTKCSARPKSDPRITFTALFESTSRSTFEELVRECFLRGHFPEQFSIVLCKAKHFSRVLFGALDGGAGVSTVQGSRGAVWGCRSSGRTRKSRFFWVDSSFRRDYTCGFMK